MGERCVTSRKTASKETEHRLDALLIELLELSGGARPFIYVLGPVSRKSRKAI